MGRMTQIGRAWKMTFLKDDMDRPRDIWMVAATDEKQLLASVKSGAETYMRSWMKDEEAKKDVCTSTYRRTSGPGGDRRH